MFILFNKVSSVTKCEVSKPGISVALILPGLPMSACLKSAWKPCKPGLRAGIQRDVLPKDASQPSQCRLGSALCFHIRGLSKYQSGYFVGTRVRIYSSCFSLCSGCTITAHGHRSACNLWNKEQQKTPSQFRPRSASDGSPRPLWPSLSRLAGTLRTCR